MTTDRHGGISERGNYRVPGLLQREERQMITRLTRDFGTGDRVLNVMIDQRVGLIKKTNLGLKIC